MLTFCFCFFFVFFFCFVLFFGGGGVKSLTTCTWLVKQPVHESIGVETLQCFLFVFFALFYEVKWQAGQLVT